MSREWKPGDVAMVRRQDGSETPAMFGGLNWHCARGSYSPLDPGAEPRPLVVIDPEDREQVSLLAGLLADALHDWPNARRISPDLLASTLRSLIEPPKPDEPQGLGAVVEDVEGKRYVRTESTDPKDNSLWEDAHGDYSQWHFVPAVRVLSEGWSA